MSWEERVYPPYPPRENAHESKDINFTEWIKKNEICFFFHINVQMKSTKQKSVSRKKKI